MSFFSSAKKESYSLVFNIGSGLVTGAIVKFTDKPGVDVIYLAKEKIPMQSGEILAHKHLALMKAAVSTLAKKLHKKNISFSAYRAGFYTTYTYYFFAG